MNYKMKNVLLGIAMLFLSTAVLAQNQLSGKVSDANGEPMTGAHVTLSPGYLGNYSDADGNYTIRGIKSGDYTLKVSFVGYEAYTQEISITADQTLDITLEESALMTEEVIVRGTRANEQTPTTYSSLSEEEIEERNLGQDLPFLLQMTPSLVVTSDAGAGVGYTGLRIRGSDATRVNVTINGIPLNDSESQGVFWVNMPDLASSVSSVQVQRGVGTSTNGAGAFGGSVNVQTTTLNTQPYGEINNSVGSFNTWKHTIAAGTGLIRDRFAVDVRLSQITSDGYIDRASSDLQSFFVTGGYYGPKTILKANIISGAERTYQSWYGTPESRVEDDQQGMIDYVQRNFLSTEDSLNLLTSGRTYNFYTYDNEVDDYKQDHYQLILAQELSPTLTLNTALHYTYGRGFFEQFRQGDDFADYGLNDITIGGATISSTDLVRRRWLDNDFYGMTWSFDAQPSEELSLIVGGAANRYDGGHFGEIIWAEYSAGSFLGDRYYNGDAVKDDINVYAKANYQATEKLSLFADLQYRIIDYTTAGVDNDLVAYDVDADFGFFNPKAGINYQLNERSAMYASYAVGNREPVRSDFIDAPAGRTPKAENLQNLELGYKRSSNSYAFALNYYLMNYTDQLVLTGELNDVGSPVRTNVAKSYRTGVEAVLGYQLSKDLHWEVNATLSRNKIKAFTEVVYDYLNGGVVENSFDDTDISFSPDIIFNSQLSWSPVKRMQVNLLSRYVGDQYLDNTSNDNRRLDAYFVSDLQLQYSLPVKNLGTLDFNLLVNNVLNTAYASNGYTFNYLYGDLVVENFYYPQATRNFLLGLSFKF